MERFWLQEVSDRVCPRVYEVPQNLAIELHELECTGSTNALLLEMARGGAPVGTVVWAHRQEGGRGRLGRSFSSPVGGIYISMLVPCPKDPKDIGFTLTAKAGVAVKRAIRDVCGVECGIKWVNDIVVGGLKVCGILAQMVAREGGNVVVVGIGVNYATPLSCFREDLRGIVGSLYDMDESDAKDVPPMRSFVMSLVANLYGLVCGRECDVVGFTTCGTNSDAASGGATNGKNCAKWLCEYKGSSTILGNEVKIIQAGAVVGEGRAVLIDDDCHLHVLCDDGHETVLSTGEVSVRSRGLK